MQKKPESSEQTEYYHKVVDCQYACPAHTPVPQYIRLIAERKYTEAYMLNRRSNVFPGILGRVCDRPCEPACRRGRVEEKPVAICRLKRVAADFKSDDISQWLPEVPEEKNGKKIALVGAGPASLTVTDDLLPLGYECHLFEKDQKPGGAMCSQVPSFRLPQKVLDEETASVLNRGAKVFYNTRVKSLKSLLDQGYDAVFVGAGAPEARKLLLPGVENIQSGLLPGVEFLANVAFEHLDSLTGTTLVIGGGNTAMDCCRTALRVGSSQVKVIAPESYEQMLASPWEKEDSEREGIEFINHLLPVEFQSHNGALTAVVFKKLKSLFDESGAWNPVEEDGASPVILECNQVILAIGQSLNLDFIDPELGIQFKKDTHGNPLSTVDVDPLTYQSQHPGVFFGGDAAFGPKNIIQAVADGHQAAISIHQYCQGLSVRDRPEHQGILQSQKMTMNQWSYQNNYDQLNRHLVPHEETSKCVSSLKLEVELGFDQTLAESEAARCLNCDIQTVFEAPLCIECDACIDICPVECLMFSPESSESGIRKALPVPATNNDQAIFTSETPQTGRFMVKDENYCLHCGLCAERCPTGAWDMQSFDLKIPHAGGL